MNTKIAKGTKITPNVPASGYPKYSQHAQVRPLSSGKTHTFSHSSVPIIHHTSEYTGLYTNDDYVDARLIQHTELCINTSILCVAVAVHIASGESTMEEILTVLKDTPMHAIDSTLARASAYMTTDSRNEDMTLQDLMDKPAFEHVDPNVPRGVARLEVTERRGDANPLLKYAAIQAAPLYMWIGIQAAVSRATFNEFHKQTQTNQHLNALNNNLRTNIDAVLKHKDHYRDIVNARIEHDNAQNKSLFSRVLYALRNKPPVDNGIPNTTVDKDGDHE